MKIGIGVSDSFQRQAFLYILIAGEAFAFTVWSALFKNFAVEAVGVDGLQNALLETGRELPGFLAFTTVLLLAYIREQRLALIAVLILGLGVAVTGWATTLTLLMGATIFNSIGFHYFYTVYKSLSLQWFDERTTPLVLGRAVSVGNAAKVIGLGLFLILFWRYEVSYVVGYLAAGAIACLCVAIAWVGFPNFTVRTKQRQTFVLRWRYGLYYILTFLSGARRQIFVVFATFILVDIFGLSVVQMLGLLLVNAGLNTATGLLLGPAINRYGERLILQVEYVGLFLVFLTYGLALSMSHAPWALPLVIGLYIVDHILFQFAIGMESYFKKIADPQDLAGSAAVSFSINHIAAVTLPPLLGLLYISTSPGTSDTGVAADFLISGPTLVFWVGAGLAAASFIASCYMRLNPISQSSAAKESG